MADREFECSHECGYFSSGDDLADHERFEHSTCRFCGAEPHAWEYSVTHKPGCVRLTTLADQCCVGCGGRKHGRIDECPEIAGDPTPTDRDQSWPIADEDYTPAPPDPGPDPYGEPEVTTAQVRGDRL